MGLWQIKPRSGASNSAVFVPAGPKCWVGALLSLALMAFGSLLWGPWRRAEGVRPSTSGSCNMPFVQRTRRVAAAAAAAAACPNVF